MTNYQKVLDHGFIGLISHMGGDQDIVDAARVSYQEGTIRTSNNRGLIRYLMRHRHGTPFEMPVFRFHVKAPIFVFRQWHRHRLASINEISARYSILSEDIYIPTAGATAAQSTNNNQGRSPDQLSDNDYAAVVAVMEHVITESIAAYRYLLGPQKVITDGVAQRNPDGSFVMTPQAPPPQAIQDRRNWCEQTALKSIAEARKLNTDIVWDEQKVSETIHLYMEQNGVPVESEKFQGIARELARGILPVAAYSEMYWQANLRSIFNFISLRSDPHAQVEIRRYSDTMLEMIREHCPIAVEAFEDYDLHGAHLSQMEIKLLMDVLKRTPVNIPGALQQYGCSEREIDEFRKRFDLL